MRAWPVARSIFDAPFDAPYVREANKRTTGWINRRETGTRREKPRSPARPVARRAL